MKHEARLRVLVKVKGCNSRLKNERKYLLQELRKFLINQGFSFFEARRQFDLEAYRNEDRRSTPQDDYETSQYLLRK